MMVCEKPRPWLEMWRETFGDSVEKLRVRRPQGCPECNGIGIGGRSVVAEVIWVDEIGRQYIQRDDLLGWMTYLKLNGWHTYEDQLIDRVRAGQVDPLDAEKIMGQINPKIRDKSYSYGGGQ